MTERDIIIFCVFVLLGKEVVQVGHSYESLVTHGHQNAQPAAQLILG